MTTTITADNGVVSGSAGLKQSADSSGVLALATGSGTTAMTIDASQNVGIGIASPTQKLHVYTASGSIRAYAETGNTSSAAFTAKNSGESVDYGVDSTGGFIQVVGAKPLLFYTSATERARIESSGNLLVGMTSGANGSLNVYKNTNVVFSGTAGNSASGYYLYAGYSDSSSTAFGTLRYYVLANGDVRNSNNSYGAISDVKLKENITDATPKLEQLNQVRIVNYNLIGDENKQLGVIAQELEQVFPSMVDESVDRDEEGNDLGTTTKSVKYSVFVPMLIKAIQEQQALITTLTERITALEAK